MKKIWLFKTSLIVSFQKWELIGNYIIVYKGKPVNRGKEFPMSYCNGYFMLLSDSCCSF